MKICKLKKIWLPNWAKNDSAVVPIVEKNGSTTPWSKNIFGVYKPSCTFGMSVW